MKKTEKFLEAFEDSFGNINEACKIAGVSRTSVFSYINKHPGFAKRVWEIYEGFIDLAETTNLKLGLSGNAAALNNYLVAKAKNRGYGNVEPTNKPMYPGLAQHKEEDPELEFRNENKEKSTEDIKKELKNLKKITLRAK